MSKQQIALRLDEELVAKLDVEAEEKGVSRQQLIEQRLSSPASGIDCLIELSKSQIASMDQTAERVGLSRKKWIERVLGERIRREFVFERQKQAHGV
jgi:hypothetical protein